MREKEREKLGESKKEEKKRGRMSGINTECDDCVIV